MRGRWLLLLFLAFGVQLSDGTTALNALEDDKGAPWLALVKEANGDFDRFLNGLLESNRVDAETFQQAARAARALDNLLVNNSILTHATDEESLRATSLFYDFAQYLKTRKPALLRGVLTNKDVSREHSSLARCISLKADRLSHSIVLSRGHVELGDCYGCLIVGGGDVNCKGKTSGSMIIAAGNVALNSGHGIVSSNALIIAGETVLINERAADVVIVSPKKVQLTERGHFGKRAVLMDASATPRDLFKFPSLASYGVIARQEKGQIEVVNNSKFFMKRDVVLKQNDNNIESLGQFRRLLAHSIQIGDFDFEVERAGKTLRITQKLKKD